MPHKEFKWGRLVPAPHMEESYRRKTGSFADDDRKVAIYARKSRITHKGDSIGVQFKQRAYQFFLDQDANVYGESSDYDGHSGISVYNRTEQYKIEDDDSTFFNPKFSQGRRNRDVSERT